MDIEGGTRELSAAVLKTAMAIEEYGIEFYSELSACVADRKGAALLRSLANDEKEHLHILQRELDKLGAEGLKARPMQEYLKIIPEKVFVRPEGSCLTLDDEIAAIQKGIEVEVASISMYRDALDRPLEASAQATLEELAMWEARHKEILEENLRSLKLDGSWYGYAPILEG